MPSARATLIQASTVSEPVECCSAPRAVRTMTRAGPRASIAASSRTSAAEMPVTRSTRSGHHEATESFTSAQPVVRAAR